MKNFKIENIKEIKNTKLLNAFERLVATRSGFFFVFCFSFCFNVKFERISYKLYFKTSSLVCFILLYLFIFLIFIYF